MGPLDSALAEVEQFLTQLTTSGEASGAVSAVASTQLETLLSAVWSRIPAGGFPRGGEAQRAFRGRLGPLFWQSPLIRRCDEKPRGYAGDFEMMGAIYEGSARGETPLGRWLDAWVLEQPGFVAVRNRRAQLTTLLAAEHERGARRIADVACGAATELVDHVRARSPSSILLLDQDQGALSAAMIGLSGALGSAREQTRLTPWHGSVLALLRPKDKEELPAASQDVVYSIGLYDYLSERLAAALTQRLWRALGPQGLLCIGNFNGQNPMRHLIEAAMDWYLVYRDPPALLQLAAQLPGVERAEVVTEPTGCLHLLLARKR